MQLSVKWLGVIISAVVLTFATFAGLSRLGNIDFPPPTSNFDASNSFDQTSAVVLDQGVDMMPKIDLDFLNAAKPSRPSYKGSPLPPYEYLFDHDHMWVETPDIPSVNVLKPNIEISKDIDIYTVADRYSGSCGDAMPLSVRITPVFPTNATKSGHCNMEFQLDAKGNYINVKAVSCSEETFAQPSIKVVQRWQMSICGSEQEFDTKLVRETRITFRLTDESGNIIPE